MKTEFGNMRLARKMVAEFGTGERSIPVEMRYTEVIREFLGKIKIAKERAGKNNLRFGHMGGAQRVLAFIL